VGARPRLLIQALATNVAARELGFEQQIRHS
jgi:hypothetical protein